MGRLWWAWEEAAWQEWASGNAVCGVALGAWWQGAGQLAGLDRVPWRLLVLLFVVAALSLDRKFGLCCQLSWALPNVQAAAGNYRPRHSHCDCSW